MSDIVVSQGLTAEQSSQKGFAEAQAAATERAEEDADAAALAAGKPPPSHKQDSPEQ